MAHQILFYAALLAVVLGEAVADMPREEAAQMTEAKGTHLRGAKPESRRRLTELTDSVDSASSSAPVASMSQGNDGSLDLAEAFHVPVSIDLRGAKPESRRRLAELTDSVDSASSSAPVASMSQGNDGSLDLAEAFHVPVSIGDPVHIGSLYHGPGGRGFLDVTPGKCEGNDACVSASAFSDREQGSGTWQVSLLGADHQSKHGLESGDLVHIKSAFRGPEGQNYLDTRNIGCDDNLHCVSASSSPDRDAGSGTWEIVRAEGPGPIYYGDKVYIRNKYTGMSGVSNAYLDVRQQGCEGNRHCVSGASSVNRDRESSTWAFLPAFV